MTSTPAPEHIFSSVNLLDDVTSQLWRISALYGALAPLPRAYALAEPVRCGNAPRAIQAGQMLEVDSISGVVRALPD
jgi:hypothetical protein